MVDFVENWYREVFWVVDYESGVKFSKFNMADLIWRIKILKIYVNSIFSAKITYLGVFGVADCESGISFSKFNMADQNLKKIYKLHIFGWNHIYRGFWCRWLRIRHQFFKIQYGESTMADQNFKNVCNPFRGFFYQNFFLSEKKIDNWQLPKCCHFQ